MQINANTKIAALIKHHPQALDVLAELSPKFEKLKNPVIRKVMAGRTSIALAARLGEIPLEKFWQCLAPLGFEIDAVETTGLSAETGGEIPGFVRQWPETQMVSLDVRPVIDGGEDPLRSILQQIEALPKGYALNIINGFEPLPLMQLLRYKGWKSYVRVREPDCVQTLFVRAENAENPAMPGYRASGNDWQIAIGQFDGLLDEVDVRDLPMPQPMHRILEKLDSLAPGHALLVHHKRVPVFLLPELESRRFTYCISETGGSEIKLLIYHKER